MSFRSFFVVLVMLPTLLLSSCASGFYPRPGKQEPAAIIRGTSTQKSLANWLKTKVATIDELDAGVIFSPTQPLRIHPGKHTITIYTEFCRGWFSGGALDALNEVTFTAKANHQYVVKSKAQGNKVFSWVATPQGKIVSEKASTLARYKPNNSVIVVSR